MDNWERQHPELLADAEVSDTHFFGFNSRGKLSELFDYVFVSADLRAVDETSGAKGRYSAEYSSEVSRGRRWIGLLLAHREIQRRPRSPQR